MALFCFEAKDIYFQNFIIFQSLICTISGATIFNNLIMKNRYSAEDLEPESTGRTRNLYIRLQTLTLIQIVIILGLALVISNGKF
jgi:hypothetical protein